MNWAAEHELPPAQKTPHHAVSYQDHPDGDERCRNCHNLVREAGEKPRCRTVKDPISVEGYCVRYSPEHDH